MLSASQVREIVKLSQFSCCSLVSGCNLFWGWFFGEGWFVNWGDLGLFAGGGFCRELRFVSVRVVL